MEQSKKSEMNIFDILNLRSQWEDLVKDFQMEDDRKQGTIDNIKWFIKHGLIGNRFRKGCDDAYEIAETILRNV